MVDNIARQYYDQWQADDTARILNANPTLCEQPARLPAGISIVIPERGVTRSKPTIKLWD